MLVGSTEDPSNGPAVARVIFMAVVVYIVRVRMDVGS